MHQLRVTIPQYPYSLLTALHQLNAVLEEHVSVLIAEPVSLVGHLASVMLDCEPSRESYIVLLTWQLHLVEFLRGGGGSEHNIQCIHTF